MVSAYLLARSEKRLVDVKPDADALKLDDSGQSRRVLSQRVLQKSFWYGTKTGCF